MSTSPERTATTATTTIGGMIATGLTSALALYVVDVPREWQVTLCLALLVAVGVAVGLIGRPAAWFRVSLLLALTAGVVFALSSIGLDPVAFYWLLALILFLPAAVLLSAAAVGLTRLFTAR